MSEKREAKRLIAENVIFAILLVIIGFPFFLAAVAGARDWPEGEKRVMRSEVVAEALGHDNSYRAKFEMGVRVGGQPLAAELTSFDSKNCEATFVPRSSFQSVATILFAMAAQSFPGTCRCRLEPDVLRPADPCCCHGVVLFLRRSGVASIAKA